MDWYLFSLFAYCCLCIDFMFDLVVMNLVLVSEPLVD